MSWSLRRTFGRMFIPESFSKGYSAIKTLDILKGLGYSYRKTDFLADWREITGVKKVENAYRFIPKRHKPSLNLITEASTRLKKNYTYLYDVRLTDRVTGEVWHRDYRMCMDTLESVGFMEDEFWSRYGAFIEEDYEPEFYVSKVTLRGVLRRRIE